MKTPAAILNSATLTATIAEAVAYNEVGNGTALMIHNNSHEFQLVSADRIRARVAQGWSEAVSYATLVSLGVNGETSDDGMEEAAKIAAWMREQA